MKTVVSVKKIKIALAILGVLLFVSCSYDDSGFGTTGLSENETNNKEVLGFNPSNGPKSTKQGSDGVYGTTFYEDPFYDDDDDEEEDVVSTILDVLNNTSSRK